MDKETLCLTATLFYEFHDSGPLYTPQSNEPQQVKGASSSQLSADTVLSGHRLEKGGENALRYAAGSGVHVYCISSLLGLTIIIWFSRIVIDFIFLYEYKMNLNMSIIFRLMTVGKLKGDGLGQASWDSLANRGLMRTG